MAHPVNDHVAGTKETAMSIGNEDDLFEAIKSRHRALRLAGAIATLIGLVLAAYVGYEWFIWRTGHEIIALLAAVAILFGVQLLIFSTLTSMLVSLHREQLHRLD